MTKEETAAMINELPGYYRRSRLVKALYEAAGAALESLDHDIEELDKNLFAATAEDLTRHEADVGLTPSPPDTDTETIRAGVIARLRGNGVFTVEALKELAAAYEPTGAEVTEDCAEYTVTLTFANREGQPPNISELFAAIEEVKPAHIRVTANYVRNPSAAAKLGGVLGLTRYLTMSPAETGSENIPES